MARELQVPPLIDFDFNTGRESPSIDTRPFTPKRFGEVCCSAPTSPARDYTINDGFDYELGDWYERTWCFSSTKRVNNSPFSSSSGSPNVGKLKTKGPIFGGPHGVDETEAIKGPLLSPNNIPNLRMKKSFWSTFSPKRKKQIEFNPFEDVGMRETITKQMRGRGRESDLPALRSGWRATRSLSPLRVSKYLWEDQEEEKVPRNTNQFSSSSSVTKPPFPLKGSRKWRLKDFLLFRSASEGRTSENDPFRKYAEMYRKQKVARSSRSKPADEFGLGVIPSPRRGQISAHELHYTVNKAISQDMKKKSFLPYKQGILGRLAVNPTAHALAYGFGSVPNNYS